jgi:GT2 family glycosyltransferase
MALGVIILNWNAADDTIACLRSIQTWQDLSSQVWVVDNGSEDGGAERIARAHPYVRLIRSRFNRGFAGGNNLALVETLEAGCEQVLLLNNDATIDVESVATLLETLRSRPDIGIIGPTVWDSDRPQVLLSAGGTDMARNLVSHILEPPSDGELRLVAYVPGTCVLIRTAVLHAVGLLDEDYFFGGELADLCERARRHGLASAVDGRAQAYHRIDRSSELRHSLHIYYVLRNRFLFIRKFYAGKRLVLFSLWLAYGAYLAALALAHGQRRRARAVLLGLVDGLRGRFGGQNERVLGR